MDEEMEYAEMLEIPVSTVNVTKKRGRKPKKQTDLKDKVITKVNEKTDPEAQDGKKNTAAQDASVNTPVNANANTSVDAASKPQAETEAVSNTDSSAAHDSVIDFSAQENTIISESAPIAIPRRKKRPFLVRLFGGKENIWEYETPKPQKAVDPFLEETDAAEPQIYSYDLYQKEKGGRDKKEKRYSLIVGIEFAACVALCAGIFLTNVFYPTSAINTFFKSLTQNSAADARTYSDFTLSSILSEENAELNLSPTGILSFTEKGCVYPAVDGTVTEISQNADGTWMIKISHSPTFSEIINGLSYAACSVGSELKSNVPVGYSDGKQEVQVSMYDDGALLNCFYVTENGDLAWTKE